MNIRKWLINRLFKVPQTPFWTDAFAGMRARLAAGEYVFTEELGSKAQNWPTCICGNQPQELPRTEGGAPRDDKLRNLGFMFSDRMEELREREYNDNAQVTYDEISELEGIMHEIEARATTIIIKDMESKRRR